jgi:hypothetical protein
MKPDQPIKLVMPCALIDHLPTVNFVHIPCIDQAIGIAGIYTPLHPINYKCRKSHQLALRYYANLSITPFVNVGLIKYSS